ncbi:MAG TPA: hypothetical protein VM733_07980 [Thermoanaerobaculia bacterium]|nr:hypothetical protein [Thermoanaerobaculia bacterium]
MPRINLTPSTLLRIGMVTLILFALTRWPVDLQTVIGENAVDGLRGFLIAVSGGFNILSIVRRRQACA